MSYSDQKFYARTMVPVAFSKAITVDSTGTAETKTDIVILPKFFRRCKVNAAKLIVVTQGAACKTDSTLQFLNGTSTFASFAIGTGTAPTGTLLDGTVTAANGTFTAGAAPTVTIVGVNGTGAALAVGTYTILFEVQELFS